jgi:hypothetical protein
MTAASGTPLILSILSLVVSLVVGVGAVLMARANLQRQIQVASREAWKREFRERAVAFVSSFSALRDYERTHAIHDPERHAELDDALLTPYHTLRLLIAEKGTQYVTLIPVMVRVLEAEPSDAAARVHEFYDAVEDILQRERATIEAPGRWRPWVSQQFRARLHRILTPPSRW